MENNIIKKFNGVYLLQCQNRKFKGRTYIGYTVDPVRRLKRHNAGYDFGGAKKTSNKGPWSMVMIIHGFPNSRIALRFEWAWQHLDLSRHTKHIPKKKSNQLMINYLISSVAEMLKVPPWCRLPLTIQWLDLKFSSEWILKLEFPSHMQIHYGAVEQVKRAGWVHQKQIEKFAYSNNKFENNYLDDNNNTCFICKSIVNNEDKVECVYKNCKCINHIVCLAKLFCRKDKKILPINGICPECHNIVSWGDIVKKKIGCYVML